MVERIQEKPSPPYVSYRTWNTFLLRLREHLPLPPVLDTSFWHRIPFSGTNKSALRGALIYLGLMSATRHPADSLERLTKADGEERKNLLREVVTSAYQGLLAKVDLRRATVGDMRSYFREVGASGGAKGVNFFLSMARDAGLELHPSLTTRRWAARRKRAQPEAHAIPPGKPLPGANLQWAGADLPYSHPILKALLDQLPQPGPWEGKKLWKKAWEANIDMLYPDGNER